MVNEGSQVESAVMKKESHFLLEGIAWTYL